MKLQKSCWIDDWFVLDEHKTSQPEGTAEEWRSILTGLLDRSSVRFRRVAVWFDDGKAHFISPRNSVCDSECFLFESEIEEFVSKSTVLLDEHQQVVSDGAGI